MKNRSPYTTFNSVSENRIRFDKMVKIKGGLYYYPNYLHHGQIAEIYQDIKEIVKTSPFFQPVMPRFATPLSVKMTNAGRVGWVSTKQGYRYQPHHPDTEQPWAEIPKNFLAIWSDLVGKGEPDCCLINYYKPDARMGLHVDNDEKDFSMPVVSISLGASCLFRIGGLNRSDPTTSIKLNDGDIIVLSGDSRKIYHGVDKIYPTEKNPYRLNITMRKAL